MTCLTRRLLRNENTPRYMALAVMHAHSHVAGWLAGARLRPALVSYVCILAWTYEDISFYADDGCSSAYMCEHLFTAFREEFDEY